MQDYKAKLQEVLDKIGNRHVDTRLLILFAAFALLLIGYSSWLAIADTSGRRAADRAAEEGQIAVDSVNGLVATIEKALHDERSIALAEVALADPARKGELLQYLQAQLPEIKDVLLVGPDLASFDP